MSYFFVTTLQAFFCIALLSAVLWGRGAPPVLRPLVWTLLTALGCGLLAGCIFARARRWSFCWSALKSSYRCCFY